MGCAEGIHYTATLCQAHIPGRARAAGPPCARYVGLHNTAELSPGPAYRGRLRGRSSSRATPGFTCGQAGVHHTHMRSLFVLGKCRSMPVLNDRGALRR